MQPTVPAARFPPPAPARPAGATLPDRCGRCPLPAIDHQPGARPVRTASTALRSAPRPAPAMHPHALWRRAQRRLR
ncbi:hypothetical protein G6F64_015004 [Rhizopus arrhizus]|uniref:Uncharacterized protein n=1 Tax=Rhizopus oryzae TaxID=64495 RepID=A0A9P7BI88_RHIOR|nr:hypothetical protein G6F68_019470 [Rhizopus microsporus]KAG1274950.1 hypothetical protein G6F64_015004 [Rhizopus arrhizus]KAG1396341.1 hypothetical protein G6F59_013822 [Rhizopus arrhizus]